MELSDLKYTVLLVYLGYAMWMVRGVARKLRIGQRPDPSPVIHIAPPA
ncbi:MAG TPA: hypothetical protein VD866_20170 [Urbifossiella sp.]|nr:hypothetical protein [Urbifossiella sp.]